MQVPRKIIGGDNAIMTNMQLLPKAKIYFKIPFTNQNIFLNAYFYVKTLMPLILAKKKSWLLHYMLLLN